MIQAGKKNRKGMRLKPNHGTELTITRLYYILVWSRDHTTRCHVTCKCFVVPLCGVDLDLGCTDCRFAECKLLFLIADPRRREECRDSNLTHILITCAACIEVDYHKNAQKLGNTLAAYLN